MVKMKKAQGQIITTILIILLILAAIVIVWQVVGRTVQKGSGEISSQTDCIGIDLEIESASEEGGITIRRGVGGPDEAVQVYAVVEGRDKILGDSAGIEELGLDVFLLGDVNVGDKVEAGVILDGNICSPVASGEITVSEGVINPCSEIDLEITRAEIVGPAIFQIDVTRYSGGPSEPVQIYIRINSGNEIFGNPVGIAVGSIETWWTYVVEGDLIESGAVLGDGTICEPEDSEIMSIS